MSTVFLESSALLRMLLDEEGSEETQGKLAAASHVTASRLLQVEAARSLIRVALERPELEKQLPSLRRQLADFWPVVSFFELTRGICELAGRIAPHSRLRTLDALHLATYQKAREIDPATEMLSFDRRILEEL